MKMRMERAEAENQGMTSVSLLHAEGAPKKNNKFRILFETLLLGESSLSVPPIYIHLIMKCHLGANKQISPEPFLWGDE